MPSYKAPVRDLQFVIHELLSLTGQTELTGFDEVTPDLVDAILAEGAKLTEEVLHPLNLPGDEEGCHWDNGNVITPKGFKDAYKLYKDGGWQGMTSNPDHGGQGMPQTLGLAISEMMIAANWGFAMYPGLTKGATEALEVHASDDIKNKYLPNMVSGEWSGTMNLTEPQCGTDLGLIRTKAVPQSDGSYKLTGTKIFISAGEHDLTDNIIHLVLARLPDAPEGIKGISLFVVPKMLVNDDGSLGGRNGVQCARIEEKMGIHSNATCVLNYDDAQGWLIGEANKGMRAMFTMMNEARLGVALQGLAIAEVAYQNAAAYAKDRIQGRALTGPQDTAKPADPIIVHPDVRRMLMTIRAFNEGTRALALWTGLQADITRRHPDAAARQTALDMLSLMTPVAKSYLTDKGFEATNLALQCLGGHGYIREWGMEQFVRDARIAMIYEGTNGVQAMDLIGRKLPADGGRSVRAYFALVQDFITAEKDTAEMTEFTAPLGKSLQQLQQATMWLMQHGMKNPDNAGAGAHDYLNLMALVTLGWLWARMAKTAQAQLAAGTSETEFYTNKLQTARFYFARVLPETATHLARVESGADPVMALAADAF
ncbi:acyl-CoA dehydrogenase C-terminal domain-containing protein [Govanella unica]|uniref:3-methylmercaptopropionyl-CoA dehydrogenase n=1 Tax=Govanella unica TaxID=2975056 RepID=A0A9X3TVE5_9PROT|nr:acyl-CoA dehydrogenase C-terminal domain-containing protein [Govania unica]MDA5192475.1 acyl-CoA dehydrogenase C-terminal domain-containing protein [Govania unica]